MGQRDGRARVGSGQGCLSNPSGGTPADGRQRRRGPGEPAGRLDRLGRQRRPLLRRRQRGLAGRRRLLRVLVERDGGLEPGRHESRLPTTLPTAVSRHRSRSPTEVRSSRAARSGQMTYALNTANGSAGHRVAAVLRRQRVLHRGGGRLLRHRLGRLRRRRGVVAGVRPRDALLQRRACPDLQRPRRTDLQRQHERGGRLLPRRRAHPARRRLRHRHRDRHLLPGCRRREHRQGLRHQVPPGVERHPRRLDGRQPRAGRRAGQRAARRGRGHRQRRSVYALDAATGQIIWQVQRAGRRPGLGHHG